MKLLDYEKELICNVDINTRYIIEPKTSYDKSKFYGWNLYAETNKGEILIETYDDTETVTGLTIAKNELNSIIRALELGVLVYVVTTN